jgi:hypothetical protein
MSSNLLDNATQPQDTRADIRNEKERPEILFWANSGEEERESAKYKEIMRC